MKNYNDFWAETIYRLLIALVVIVVGLAILIPVIWQALGISICK